MPNCKDKPNILLIIADDHRHEQAECISIEKLTPNLDSLKKSGIHFRNVRIAGANCPAICAPTRAALHTGHHPSECMPSNTSINNFEPNNSIPENLPLLGEQLKDAGYHTFITGKWHNDELALNRSFENGDNIFLGGMSDQFTTPLHHYDPRGRYPKEEIYQGDQHSTDIFCNTASTFIREYEYEKPFFVYLALTSPHDPRDAPKGFQQFQNSENLDLPPNFLKEHPFDNGELNIRDEGLARHPREESEIRGHLADYYAMLAHQDFAIGRILDSIRSRENLKDTIIVYTSDHGIALGQHGLMGKQNLYEHSVRVPLYIAGGEIPHGRVVDAPVYTADLYATLLGQAGAADGEAGMSRSLEGYWRPDLSTRTRSKLFCNYKDLQASIVTDDGWKLIRYRKSAISGQGCDFLQLFNLKDDPWELINLSEVTELASTRQYLLSALEDWVSNIRPFG